MVRASGTTMSEAPTAPSDEQLVARSVGGDVGAFNELVVRWEGPLYKFVYRYLGDPEEARDICQEAFLRAYSNLSRFRSEATFSSWLFQIALNQSRSQFRRKQSRPTVALEDDDNQHQLRLVQDSAEAPDLSAMGRQRSSALKAAIAKLPEAQREVIILKQYHGLKFREIAEVLGTPESTVKSRLYHGFESLAKSLGHLKTEGLEL